MFVRWVGGVVMDGLARCLGWRSPLVNQTTNQLPTSTPTKQDIEFTVQEGKLYVLQCRSGKRTAKAAVKVAVDMVGGVWML